MQFIIISFRFFTWNENIPIVTRNRGRQFTKELDNCRLVSLKFKKQKYVKSNEADLAKAKLFFGSIRELAAPLETL